MSAETVKLHEIIATGALENLREALDRGMDPDAPGHMGQTALMAAIEAKSLEKVKLLIDSGADPELTNDFNATALACAVGADWPEGVGLLLSLGVDRGYEPKHPLKKIHLPPLPEDIEMPADLKGFLSEEEWAESMRETQDSIREMGENPTAEPIIADVQSVEVLKLFITTGDDLNLAPEEVKREMVGLGGDDAFRATRADYRKHKSPRHGKHNPERMDNPFWRDMVRLGVNAYEAKQHFGEKDISDGPVWCFDRFGDTITPLPDGRFVQVAGEHEDFYDPDFCIYNDVVVHDGQGGIEIFGYPADVFPPTDFHTATLVDDWIYLIGSLGYPEQREAGRTPVYLLRLGSWDIAEVETTGKNPGWLHGHCARYNPGDNTIRVSKGKVHEVDANGEAQLLDNTQQFELDLGSLRWRRLD